MSESDALSTIFVIKFDGTVYGVNVLGCSFVS